MLSKKPFRSMIENPVHFPPVDRHIQRIQRVMLTASRPKPVGESPKVFLINLIEDRDHSALDNLVFQRRNPQRPLFRRWPSVYILSLRAAPDTLRGEPGRADL